MSFSRESFVRKNYVKMYIDLTSKPPHELPVVGDYINARLVDSNLTVDDVYIWLNDTSGNPLTLRDLPARTPFGRIIITYKTPATGKLELLIGHEYFQPGIQRVYSLLEEEDIGLMSELRRDTELGVIPVTNYFPERTGTWSLALDRYNLTGANYDSSTVGSTMTMRFRGRKVGVIFLKAGDRGIAGISIDGGAEELVDLYSPYAVSYIWLKEGLEDGEHTLTIRVTGQKNPSSTGIKVSVEGFIVEKSKNPTFTFDRFIRQAIGSLQTEVFGIWYYYATPTSAKLIGADESVAQTLQLDTFGRKLLEVYAKATTATTFHLDVSPDNSYWINDYKVYSNVTVVKDTLWNGFRYVRLRSDPAGTSGTDTVDMVLSAKA